MPTIRTVTNENFEIFAVTHYDNPFCLSEEEFKRDCSEFTNLKRYLTIHINGDADHLKLLTNKLIIIYNVFLAKAATELIKFKLDEDQYHHINAFLLYLNKPTIGETYNKDIFEQLEVEYGPYIHKV